MPIRDIPAVERIIFENIIMAKQAKEVPTAVGGRKRHTQSRDIHGYSTSASSIFRFTLSLGHHHSRSSLPLFPAMRGQKKVMAAHQMTPYKIVLFVTNCIIVLFRRAGGAIIGSRWTTFSFVGRAVHCRRRGGGLQTLVPGVCV